MAWVRLDDGKHFMLDKSLRELIRRKLVCGFNADFTASLLGVPKEVVLFVERSFSAPAGRSSKRKEIL